MSLSVILSVCFCYLLAVLFCLITIDESHPFVSRMHICFAKSWGSRLIEVSLRDISFVHFCIAHLSRNAIKGSSCFFDHIEVRLTPKLASLDFSRDTRGSANPSIGWFRVPQERDMGQAMWCLRSTRWYGWLSMLRVRRRWWQGLSDHLSLLPVQNWRLSKLA